MSPCLSTLIEAILVMLVETRTRQALVVLVHENKVERNRVEPTKPNEIQES